MIPRLGDGNVVIPDYTLKDNEGLENDSPSRGRKRSLPSSKCLLMFRK